ncbi:serine/threonine-protein kinase [Actinokineospora sp. G85]|uniref:serine/threonine-protein kinase n=1 Tax=Actinokineospora sp. G85 TaxID=3406626 RepID=UPI003C777C52
MTAALSAALPQYEVGAEIGSGGMGVVFAGVHRSLGRQVAIKRLSGSVTGDPEVNARFDREARVLASLDHPHIVPVYDYVRTGSDNLLVMERLDGGTVWDAFTGRGLTGEQSCALTLAMLAGLHAAHTAGVLHLDIKPKNLLFTTTGVVKVADFGIARVISEGATLMTHGGEVLGTPAYIAPEQAMGNPLSPAADLYSAGTVLYELLSGDLPFDRTRGAISMLRQRMFTDPTPLRAVPAPLSTVVMRSLARDPAHRYRDAEAFAVDLATAAATVFGPGWLERANVPVHLGPRVVSAATTSPGTAPTTATAPVRGAHRDERTQLFEPTELRPAHEVLSGPPFVVPLLVGLVALVAMVVLPFLAPFSIAHQPGRLEVGGQPNTNPFQLDLSKPVPVRGTVGSGAPFVLEFSLSTAGVPLGTVRAPIVPAPDGAFEAEVEPQPLMRWVVGGAVTGSLSIDGEPPQEFTVRTPQHPLASVMGGGSLLLGLFAVASLESLMRALRRGHRRPSAPYAAAPLGVLLGVAVWLLTSTLLGREPSTAFALGTAAAGLVSAVALVIATAWRARRTTRTG